MEENRRFQSNELTISWSLFRQKLSLMIQIVRIWSLQGQNFTSQLRAQSEKWLKSRKFDKLLFEGPDKTEEMKISHKYLS